MISTSRMPANLSLIHILGIIGTHGSGKSTLLKIITGVLNPTDGEVTVDGRISALLELGAGFNMEYTGIENVYLNGTMIGFTKEEIDERLQDILAFADIGDFVNQPVKTYSSAVSYTHLDVYKRQMVHGSGKGRYRRSYRFRFIRTEREKEDIIRQRS